jgi:hypothetical protein
MTKLNKKIRYLLIIIGIILLFFDCLYIIGVVSKSIALPITIAGLVLLSIASFTQSK